MIDAETTSTETARERLVITGETTPALQTFVKLRHDKGRDRWIILAPERILTPDAIAVTVLELCDGTKSIDEMSNQLSESYNAPKDVIKNDIINMLQDLADKGYIRS